MVDKVVTYITDKEKMGYKFVNKEGESDEQLAARVFLEVFIELGVVSPDGSWEE